MMFADKHPILQVEAIWFNTYFKKVLNRFLKCKSMHWHFQRGLLRILCIHHSIDVKIEILLQALVSSSIK